METIPRTKIAIAGIGYVGLSIATLLSQQHDVYATDVIQERVEKTNQRISVIKDEYIEKYFKEKKLSLTATMDYKEAFTGAEYIVICVPTNYDHQLNFFDTRFVEDVINKVLTLKNPPAIIIKSTIPIGYIESIKQKYNIEHIYFSPEFLREGKSLYDNLYPSRIIIGPESPVAEKFAKILRQASLKPDTPIKLMNSKEAESVKLFSNSYLAMRVAYFNELDNFCEIKNLNTKDIIEGVCLDPRIGSFYNNPSFGYGGLCLPKDTKQLKANFKGIPEKLISAIVSSNEKRFEHIADMIIKKLNENNEGKEKIVGIFRLIMKKGSDNFREASIIKILEIIKNKGIKIEIYEPNLNEEEFLGCKVVKDLGEFKNKSTIIVTNRLEESLNDVKEKIYTRDIFSNN